MRSHFPQSSHLLDLLGQYNFILSTPMKYHKYLRGRKENQVSSDELDLGLQRTLIGLVAGILASSQLSLITSAEATPSIDRELVEAICGVNNIVTEAQGEDILAQCTTCPSFTIDGMPGEQAEIMAVTYGSFTEPRQREAIVDLSGCERHVNNFGGSIVLRKSSSTWNLIRYEPGNRSHTCQPIKTQNQRHSLVCLDSYAQSGYVTQWLSLKEIDATETKSTPYLEAESNVASCNPPFVQGKIVNFTLEDNNNDGWKDLIVEVSSATAATREKECEDCCEANFPEPTVTYLVFTFNGSSFAATPETVQRLQNLEGIRQ